MMASLNRATLIGQLGSDPEMKNFGDTRVALLSIATTTSWTDRANQKQESTHWHRVKAFGAQADLCEQYVGRGDTIYVEGPIETRSYDDKQGVKRYVTEIRARSVQFLSQKRSTQTRAQDGGASRHAVAEILGPDNDSTPF